MKNGNQPGTIPPDIEWDENNPPTVFLCTGEDFHSFDCAGNCESRLADEMIVNIINEQRRWARLGLHFGMVPFNPFDNEIRIQVMTELIKEYFALDDHEMNEHFKRVKYERMKAIREANEEQLKQNNLRQNILTGLQKPGGLLGPDGRTIL